MSNLLLCFRNVRRNLADSRGTTQMEFWTKWSNIHSIEFNFCNMTGNSRVTIKLDKEYLYHQCIKGSDFSSKIKKSHLLSNRSSILYIDDDAIHQTNL